VRIDSGFAGVRRVMTHRARALQRTNARGTATWVSPETDGGAVGDPLDHAVLSDMAKDMPNLEEDGVVSSSWPKLRY
jgi:hypothetical protein